MGLVGLVAPDRGKNRRGISPTRDRASSSVARWDSECAARAPCGCGRCDRRFFHQRAPSSWRQLTRWKFPLFCAASRMVSFSVLDLAPIIEGGDVKDALERARD